jgi:hypothetical protein
MGRIEIPRAGDDCRTAYRIDWGYTPNIDFTVTTDQLAFYATIPPEQLRQLADAFAKAANWAGVGVPVVARYRGEFGSEYHVHADRSVSYHSQPPLELLALTADEVEAEAAAGHLQRLYEPGECPCLAWAQADMRQSHHGIEHHQRCDGTGHHLDKPREVDVDEDGWCRCERHQQWKRDVQSGDSDHPFAGMWAAHHCDNACVCPTHGIPLYYEPAAGKHGCMVPNCTYKTTPMPWPYPAGPEFLPAHTRQVARAMCPCLRWAVADIRTAAYPNGHHELCDGHGNRKDQP